MTIRHTARIIVIALATMSATIACDPGPSPIMAVTSISPNSGAAGRATEVRIKGKGFKPGAVVTLVEPASDVTVIDSETIVAKTPVSVEGKVNVEVKNPAGGGTARLTDGFQFVGAVPVFVGSLSPNTGAAGWFPKIVGSGFQPFATVTFGGVPATEVEFGNHAQIWARVPMLHGGIVDVTVTNPSGATATLSTAFTYQATTLSASPGSVSAGSTISVTWDAPLWAPPEPPFPEDWIGLFPPGVASTLAEAVWSTGVPSAQGTMNVTVPTLPGQYQVRYVAKNATQAVVGVVVTTSAASRIR